MTYWNSKIAFLELTSFSSVGIGGGHYYATIRFGDERIDLYHVISEREAIKLNKTDRIPGIDNPWSKGDTTSRYSSKELAIKTGKEKWKEEVPDADILILGEHYVAEAQLILAGPPEETIEKLNKLYQECEDLDWYEKGHDARIEEIWQEWKSIIEEANG